MEPQVTNQLAPSVASAMTLQASLAQAQEVVGAVGTWDESLVCPGFGGPDNEVLDVANDPYAATHDSVNVQEVSPHLHGLVGSALTVLLWTQSTVVP